MFKSKKISNYLDNICKKHLYKLFGLLILILSIFFCFIYIYKFEYIVDDNYKLIFSKIPFGHGPLIENLVQKNIYEGKFIDRTFVVQKMPLLPILIYSFTFISHNFFFIVIFKNLLLFFILIYFLKKYILLKNLKLKKIFIYFLVYLIPYNMFVSLNFEYADCLISILLPSLFLVLVSKENNKYIYASILLFLLYLTKNSMLFLCLFAPIFIVLFEKNYLYRFQKFFIFLGPILALIIWGSFTYVKTGKFAFGSNMLSVNSMGMNIALNKKFLEYYPKKSLDLIHRETYFPIEIKNEWEISNYFDKKNKEHLSNFNNVFEYLKTFPKKINFILFNIHRDAALPDLNGNFDNSIRYSLIPSKLLINVSLILALYIFFKNFSKQNDKLFNTLLFLLIFSAYSFPLIIAWSTSKHLVPLSIISYFYILNMNDKKN